MKARMAHRLERLLELGELHFREIVTIGCSHRWRRLESLIVPLSSSTAFRSGAGCATAAARDNIPGVVESCNPFPDKQLRLTITHGHTRGPGYWSPPHHRVDAPRPVRQPRRLADARVPARVRRPQRDRPFRRAHALQGHRHAHRGGHRPGDRLHRRPARRVHGQGIRQLLHQGPRRAPADGGRSPVRHRDEPELRRRGSRQGKEGHPRRDQDGRGHARRSGPRALHAAFLGRARARTADSRVQGDGGVLHRRDPAGLFPHVLRRAEPDRLGRRQRRAREGPRPDRARVRQAAVDARAVRGRDAPGHPAGDRPLQGARAEPRRPRHQQLSAEPRGPLRELHHEHACSAGR